MPSNPQTTKSATAPHEELQVERLEKWLRYRIQLNPDSEAVSMSVQRKIQSARKMAEALHKYSRHRMGMMWPPISKCAMR
jgi:hypothetical protein